MPKKSLEEQTAEELRDYITNVLRPENKSLREAAETAESTFVGVPAAAAKAFRNIIETYKTDPKASAMKMKQIAGVIHPDDTDPPQEDPEMSDPTQGQPPAPAPIDMEALKQFIQQTVQDSIKPVQEGFQAQTEATQAAERARLINQATQLGYQEGTPEWTLLWDMAQTERANGDVNAAHEIVKTLGQAPQVSDQHTDLTPAVEQKPSSPLDFLPQPDPPQVQPVQQQTASFPPVGSPGAGLTPDADAAPAPNPATMSKSATRMAALQYLTSAEGDGS